MAILVFFSYKNDIRINYLQTKFNETQENIDHH